MEALVNNYFKVSQILSSFNRSIFHSRSRGFLCLVVSVGRFLAEIQECLLEFVGHLDESPGASLSRLAHVERILEPVQDLVAAGGVDWVFKVYPDEALADLIVAADMSQ